jgi:hypothetical protein
MLAVACRRSCACKDALKGQARAIEFGFCLEQDAQIAKNAGSMCFVTGHDFSRADQSAKKKIGL